MALQIFLFMMSSLTWPSDLTRGDLGEDPFVIKREGPNGLGSVPSGPILQVPNSIHYSRDRGSSRVRLETATMQTEPSWVGQSVPDDPISRSTEDPFVYGWMSNCSYGPDRALSLQWSGRTLWPGDPSRNQAWIFNNGKGPYRVHREFHPKNIMRLRALSFPTEGPTSQTDPPVFIGISIAQEVPLVINRGSFVLDWRLQGLMGPLRPRRGFLWSKIQEAEGSSHVQRRTLMDWNGLLPQTNLIFNREPEGALSTQTEGPVHKGPLWSWDLGPFRVLRAHDPDGPSWVQRTVHMVTQYCIVSRYGLKIEK